MNRQQWMSENKKRARMWDRRGSLYAFLEEQQMLCCTTVCFTLLYFLPLLNPSYPSIPGIRICQVTDGDNRF
ncbi:hypothetical protein ASPFODRAFT_52984 [Aspergillus luchuensis CBS 106.47]|uniref:Uncharacterized protein n=1 Tax=Aspergillus luchuensis (strain CBS 106.47) TaxID=1137211 RepID=A0A1M3T1X1_ASPLC|nr:hypothetical protein ASPFODRAFT_52984 [Aspergillus luchuensis CBS 106.47]